MTTLLLNETFSAASFDPRLTWFNEPAVYRVEAAGLTIEPSAGSDLWQRTHYGFTPDSAHALGLEVNHDFVLETEVQFAPQHQYDQAGLLVRISKDCWLKTSIEFEGEHPSRLGSVVTNAGWSDWATQDIAGNVRNARYRITRHAGDYLVEHSNDGSSWTQIRLAHLHEDDGMRGIFAGVYACSPKAAGYRATFRSLRIAKP
jgi:regulation of enolase protein 1 (concanavalin A-like superfamily)